MVFFFALSLWGGLYLEGLIHGGAYFRNFTVLQVPKTKLKSYGDRRFSFAGPKLWNSIHAS